MPENHGMEAPPVLGYLNPLWKVTFTHNEKEFLSIPLCLIIADYLKLQGFEPEKKINPSLIIKMSAGGGSFNFPLYIKQRVNFDEQMSLSEAAEKGLINESNS